MALFLEYATAVVTCQFVVLDLDIYPEVLIWIIWQEPPCLQALYRLFDNAIHEENISFAGLYALACFTEARPKDI